MMAITTSSSMSVKALRTVGTIGEERMPFFTLYIVEGMLPVVNSIPGATGFTRCISTPIESDYEEDCGRRANSWPTSSLNRGIPSQSDTDPWDPANGHRLICSVLRTHGPVPRLRHTLRLREGSVCGTPQNDSLKKTY